MSVLKDITDHLELEPAQLTAYIDEYEAVQPYDCMIDTARAVVAFFAQDYENSEKWILSALKKNPASYMNHFYYALISKALGQYAVTATECWMAVNLATQFETPADWESLLAQINDVLGEVGPKLDQAELAEFFLQKNILRSSASYFPALYTEQDSWTRYEGKFLYLDSRKKYNEYFCVWAQSCWDGVNWSFRDALIQPEDYNLYAVTPLESWRVMKTRQFMLEQENYVLAIAATQSNQHINIHSAKGAEVSIKLLKPNLYHYINMDEAGTLSSAQEFLVSKPVPTTPVPGKKRLIFTVFVDALSQWYLSQTNFEFMPYTKAFFSQGTIFKNCYSTAEWTAPSVSSLSMGLYTTHHHIIYRSSAYRYPSDVKTVGEIFNEDGYFTAQVSGSIGTSPYWGGTRGYDTTIRKHSLGFPDSHLVQDALDYMAAFPNTCKHISLALFNVHTAVDDASEYPLNIGMAEQTALGFRDAFAKTFAGGAEKSVWKRHSDSSIRKYQAALRECDRQLKMLYDYVTAHYTEDEYIFCLHSDHGVAVVKEEDYLLKVSQTNSALMLRGAGVPAGISEEYISHIDYLPVLTKLAGIPFDFSQQDCVLPRTFGGPGRDFVYSESVYHGQSYKAAVRTGEYEYRFETVGMTGGDGLIDLSQGFSQKIFNMQTEEEVDDQELAEDFEAIVFDHIKENIKY